MKNSLKKQMLIRFTTIFIVVQVTFIIIASLLIDDFVISRDINEFENVIVDILEDEVIDKFNIEDELRNSLGGFVQIVKENNYHSVKELDIETLNGFIEKLNDHEGEIISEIDDNNLFLVARIDESHIIINIKPLKMIDEMSKLLNIYIGIVSVIIFLIMFISTYYYIDYFIRPIIRIKNATQRISEFDFEEKLEVNTNDELADLAKSINFMSDKIQNDITTLIEKERLASLGELVAGVAHEINTPLGVAVSSSTYLQAISKEVHENLDNNQLTKDMFLEFLEVIDESTSILVTNLQRAEKLVKSFKLISADQTSEVKCEFKIKEYIDSLIFSLKHEYKTIDITFDIQCDDQLNINSYPGVFSQLFTIFIMNSIIHGFENRTAGKIIISIDVLETKLVIKYGDDGKGIEEDDLKHIFEPFFTSNRINGGTGLGLNICHNLITSKLRGDISCHSKVALGTEFLVEIPNKEIS